MLLRGKSYTLGVHVNQANCLSKTPKLLTWSRFIQGGVVYLPVTIRTPHSLRTKVQGEKGAGVRCAAESNFSLGLLQQTREQPGESVFLLLALKT